MTLLPEFKSTVALMVVDARQQGRVQ
jgi:hypothetical protein